jgi:hypothetical protein
MQEQTNPKAVGNLQQKYRKNRFRKRVETFAWATHPFCAEIYGTLMLSHSKSMENESIWSRSFLGRDCCPGELASPEPKWDTKDRDGHRRISHQGPCGNWRARNPKTTFARGNVTSQSDFSPHLRSNGTEDAYLGLKREKQICDPRTAQAIQPELHRRAV